MKNQILCGLPKIPGRTASAARRLAAPGAVPQAMVIWAKDGAILAKLFRRRL
jgi:hypothetical protein